MQSWLCGVFDNSDDCCWFVHAQIIFKHWKATPVHSLVPTQPDNLKKALVMN